VVLLKDGVNETFVVLDVRLPLLAEGSLKVNWNKSPRYSPNSELVISIPLSTAELDPG
jgi:hypothetical protein